MDRYNLLNQIAEKSSEVDNATFLSTSVYKEGIVINYNNAVNTDKADGLYAAKVLRFRTLTNTFDIPENVLGYYMIDGGNLIRLSKAVKGCYIVYAETRNDYINLTGKKAVSALLQVAKANATSAKCLTVVNNIFPSQIMWSNTLKKLYKEKYAEDITDKIALLFVNAKGATRFRGRYYQLLQQAVLDNFLTPLRQFCFERGINMYAVASFSVSAASFVLPNNCIMNYRNVFDNIFLTSPKGLLEGSFIKKYAGLLLGTGADKIIAEISAEDFDTLSLNSLKDLADRLLANGISKINMCAIIDENSVAQKKLNYLKQYINTLGAALSLGDTEKDILFVYPSTTEYAYFNPVNISEVHNYNDTLENQIEQLYSEGVLCDFISEEELETSAEISGAIVLVRGKSYSKIIFPSTTTVAVSTSAFITNFVTGGGRVYSIEEKPHLIDGVRGEKVENLIQFIRLIKGKEIAQLKQSNIPLISDNEVDILPIKLKDNNMVYFLANIGDEETTLSINTFENVMQLNLITMSQKVAPLANKIGKIAGKQVVAVNGEQGSSVLYAITKEEGYASRQTLFNSLEMSNSFSLKSSSPNSFVLQNCVYRIGKAKWQNECNVTELINTLKGIDRSFTLQLKFTFYVDEKAENLNFGLSIKNPELYKISVNGTDTSAGDITALVKGGENTLELYAAKFDMALNNYNTPLEKPIIYGNFALQNNSSFSFNEEGKIITNSDFIITEMPKTVTINNITESGFWTFDGKIKLTQDLFIEEKRAGTYKISFKEFGAMLATISINGVAAGTIGFKPYELDISDYILQGENQIDISLYIDKENILSAINSKDGILSLNSIGGSFKVKDSLFIEVDSVCKNFISSAETVNALNKLTFGVKSGELVVVKGQSGVGKTTLFNVLAGHISFDSGRLTVDGKSLENMSERQLALYRRSTVSVISGDGNLIDSLTLKENMKLVAASTKTDNDILQVLYSVGLHTKVDFFPSALTQYEKLCAALAMAVIKNDKVLLLDEPIKHLNYESGKNIIKLIYETTRITGKTTVLFTSNASMGLMADRIIALKDGYITENTLNATPVPPERIEW